VAVLNNLPDRVRAFIPGLRSRIAPPVPVVRLSGTIGRVGRLRSGITLGVVAPMLNRAFSVRAAPAVAIVVDSPGGSPVQSHLIYRRIRALAEEKEKRVLVFVEDVAASGGYMIACAGDEIIVDPSSIVGSIGVVTATFGFVEALAKVGVERRVYTAGDSKVILDPFQPEKPEDVARLRAIQDEIHDLFIDIVRARRGEVLADNPDLFSGMFWSGKAAVSLGLADRTGDIRSVLRERYGEKVRVRLIQPERSLFGWRPVGIGERLGERLAERLGGRIGAGLAEAILAEAEERALRARYGL
jgi:signal peptide peptidase SppA